MPGGSSAGFGPAATRSGTRQLGAEEPSLSVRRSATQPPRALNGAGGSRTLVSRVLIKRSATSIPDLPLVQASNVGTSRADAARRAVVLVIRLGVHCPLANPVLADLHLQGTRSLLRCQEAKEPTRPVE